jgi:hypothetical protein
MKLKFLIILAFIQHGLHAQNLMGIDYIVGTQTTGDNTLELGVAYGERGDELASLFYTNIYTTIETVFKERNQNIYGLKLGFSKTFAFVNIALQGSYFNDLNKRNAFVFKPELGITYLGILNLNYVRNILINDSNPMQIAPNSIVLRLTVGKTSKSILRF